MIALTVGVAFCVLVPLPGRAWLSAVLIVGTPFFGSLYALASKGAGAHQLNHGIAFALTNLTWAARQAFAASASGALAEATSDLVPYTLLSVACLATLVT